MENEFWIPITEFETLYEVSNLGRVKSLDRTITIALKNSCYTRVSKGKILKQTPDKDGYLMVGLHLKGHTTTKKVHRLVCSAFHLNPDEKPQVNHKDGIKSNNFDDNLEWATDIENKKHANENGLSRYLTGKEHRLTGTDGNNNKWVINTITGEKFSSIRKAAISINMGYSNLEKQLSGKYKNKTSLKYLLS